MLKLIQMPERQKVPSHIPCKGRWIEMYEHGRDFDCDYENVGSIDCSDCVCNGGSMDPRTGKRYVERRKNPEYKK